MWGKVVTLPCPTLYIYPKNAGQLFLFLLVELAEVLDADALLVDLDGLLDSGIELVVDGMLMDHVTGAVVLHEALGLLTHEVLGSVVDTILRQLLLGKDEGGGVDVLFLNLDAELLGQVILNELPTQ